MKTVDIRPVMMSSVYRIMKFCMIDFLNINKFLSFRHVHLSCEKCVCTLSCLSVAPSVRVYQRYSHWTDFHGI